MYSYFPRNWEKINQRVRDIILGFHKKKKGGGAISSKKGVHSAKDSEKETKAVVKEVIFLALESLDISDLQDRE